MASECGFTGIFGRFSKTLILCTLVNIVAQGAAPLPYGRASPAAPKSYGVTGVTGD